MTHTPSHRVKVLASGVRSVALGITSAGAVYAVTDIDWLDDATGETQLFDLGPVTEVFVDATSTTPRLGVDRTKVRLGQKVRYAARVAPRFVDGRVQLRDGRRVLRTVRLDDGRISGRLRLGTGKHVLRAVYLGTQESRGSRSAPVTVRVTGKRRR